MEKGSLSFDKRKHPRIQVQAPIRYKLITESEEALVLMEQHKSGRTGSSRDVSAEGMFLIGEHRLTKGDILKAEVFLPDDPHPVRAFAEVIWCLDQNPEPGKFGSGIYFMAVKDEDAERLRQFVERALANEVK